MITCALKIGVEESGERANRGAHTWLSSLFIIVWLAFLFSFSFPSLSVSVFLFLFSGEFDNAGAMMSVDESLMCSFQILKPADKKSKYAGYGRTGTPGSKK